MPHHRLPLLLLGGLLAIASGCSRKPVQVLVTLDSKPVEGATVTLTPEGKGEPASGLTGADGTATLNTSSKKGVAPGTYKVTVSKMQVTGGVSGDPSDKMGASGKDIIEMMKGGGKGAKSELPQVYSGGKSPLTLKVPPESSPAKIELKANP
jgi:hypothetical protein